MQLTLADYMHRVNSGNLQADDVFRHYVKQSTQDMHNAWIHLDQEHAQQQFSANVSGRLCGAPLAVKDNILTAGSLTTCGSKILEGYIPPYSATCYEKLTEAGGVVLGKANMDEFAMGSSTEYSSYGVTANPYDISRVAGGSSGGSAVAVATDQCLGALGTETGGSVRQPAALCGIVGVKPSYGRVSRYGVQAMASGLDQVGVFGKTVEDSCILLESISGHDAADATSVDRGDEPSTWKDQLTRDTLQGIKLALPKQFMGEGLDPRIHEQCRQAISRLEALGATVEEIDMPLLKYTIPIYYILVPAEVSTNMARFDGLRFGLQKDTLSYDNIYEYYQSIRHDGFGDEVKRRIMIGSYVLSAGHYDAYYHKALQVRDLLKKEFDTVFADYDGIVGPTTPNVAWKVGEKGDDPIQMYLEDIYTAAANLIGIPAISVPVGLVKEGDTSLPVGFQIMTQHWREDLMFGIAHQLEKVSNFVRPDLYFQS